MKARTVRTGWIATACVAVAGCSTDALAPIDGGDGTGGIGMAGSSGGAGALSGAGGASSGTAGTTALGGTGGFGGGSGGIAGTAAGATAGTSAGASGGGVAGSVSGSGGIAGQAGLAGAAPTFTELWNQTLESGCATPYCHDGSGKGWSGFDKATAYSTLVGAASTTCPGEARVVAGDPAASVLAAAVSHVDLGSCDVPTMPRNRTKLDQADIDRIVAWIRAGARDD